MPAITVPEIEQMIRTNEMPPVEHQGGSDMQNQLTFQAFLLLHVFN